MDPFLKTRTEVETLYEILHDLDYYRILHIARDAPQADVDASFQRESRWLHPDRYTRLGDPVFLEKVNEIFRFLSEARRTLKNPDARSRYDAELDQGAKRLSASSVAQAARDAAAQASPEFAARSTKGEHYWKMALNCWEDKNLQGCAMNIQFALHYEPDNEVFKEWLARVESARNDAAKDKGFSYKLRILEKT
jgi:curved DNA-binding protein CbpA